MKVLLISANPETITMPTLPLGLASVAAAIEKAEHGVTMVDLMAGKDGPWVLEETIKDFVLI